MMKLLLVQLLVCCCCSCCCCLAPTSASFEPLPVPHTLLRATRSATEPHDEEISKSSLAATATTTTAAAATPPPPTTTTSPTTSSATPLEASGTSVPASKTITNALGPAGGGGGGGASDTGTPSEPRAATVEAGTAVTTTEAPSVLTNATLTESDGAPAANLTAAPLPAGTWSPRSDKAHILKMFHKFFLQARSHDDQQRKEFVRDGVVLRMRELGFKNSFIQKSRFEFRRRPTHSDNMISILPGRHRGTPQEKIVLVGAHWDSATKAPGVDDNGSGSTCLLEIARLISAHKCAFNHTVMLVWFDYEEQGKYGSEFFVNDYLYPHELDKHKSHFIGAYILDMILVRDKEANSQQLPASLRSRLPEFFEELDREKNRGDFLATWARKRWDEPLEATFRWAWEELGYESRTFKAMRPELPQRRMPNADERYLWKDFFRSDHASFWFPPLTSPAVRKAPNRTSGADHASLNAILLTDLGPWRQSYKNCYHAACDDQHLLTDGNLAFMQQVVDALVLSLMRAAEGRCEAPQKAGAESTALSGQQQTLDAGSMAAPMVAATAMEAAALATR